MNKPFEQATLSTREIDTAQIYKLFSEQNATYNASRHAQNRHRITISTLTTPLGRMFAGTTEGGICLLEFSDRSKLETQIKRLKKWLNAEFIPGHHSLLAQLKQQLQEYFKGMRQDFTVPIDLPGTDFQQQAWKALQDIPYGTTRSYQQQAQAIGRTRAVRAVAKANAENRIAIVIPCHRVIGKNGQLTGYAGGIWRKQRLLELEGALPQISK